MLSISMKLLIRQKIWNLKLFQPLVRGSRGINKHVGNFYSQLKMRGLSLCSLREISSRALLYAGFYSYLI